jgi:hypothetical protein
MMASIRTGATSRKKPASKGKPTPNRAGPTETEDFFRQLGERGYEPILKGDSGTLRFDVDRGGRIERWFITVACGDVSVSHARGRADGVVRLNGDLFDQLIAGTANAVSAQLRGVLVVEGDLHLFLVFQRLFPSPPRSGKNGPFHLGVPEGANR